jgi:fimbrial chaperone protein
MRDTLRRVRPVVAALALLAATPARAAEVGVSPVALELSAQRAVTVLNVTNQDTSPVSFETGLFAWSQAGEADTLAETDELIATPPIFTIPGGATQVVRVGLFDPGAAAPVERAFRLVLTEVVPESEASSPGVRLRTELSLPVFVQPSAPADVALRAVVARDPAGGASLRLENLGNVHVTAVQIVRPGTTRQVAPLARHVLLGVTATFRLSAEAERAVEDGAVAQVYDPTTHRLVEERLVPPG